MSHFYRPVYSYSMPPHQRNHTLYSDHYYPTWEMASPQIIGDPGRPPIMYEPPSFNGGYVYLNPAECHGCCAHSYSPVPYGFRPPHSHPPPPPFPLYHHGPYPPYPEAYSPYLVPPPHYSVGQPRYDYDKNVPVNHCCGCPNHRWNSKVDSNVKIEEQDPEVEKAEGKFSEPIKSGDYQKPIVWIPPGYMKENDRKWLSESGPQAWIPFDISNIKSLKQGDQEGRKQDKQNEETKTHFPYPIIWMPAYEKPQEAETKDLKEISSAPKSSEGIPSNQHQQNEDRRSHFPFPFFFMPAHDMRPEAEIKDLKEVSNGSKTAEGMPPKLKIIPVKLLQNDDRGDKPEVADDTSGVQAKVAEEELKPKSITVKPMEEVGGNKSSGETGKESKSIPATQLKDNNAKKTSHGSTKIQPASPKESKLPPVCLRVDPLPRRKNANGSSRSPSPPGGKGKPQKQSDETLRSPSHTGKESQDSRMPDPNMNKVSEEQGSKNDTEEKVRDNGKREDTRKSLRDVPVVAKEEVSGMIPVAKVAKMDGKEQKTDNEEVESKTEQLEDVRRKKKCMSASEAAVLIQSAYRGYEVRKWEPLKKLRQVAKVREQMEEVREHIHALESSPELCMDEKQKLIIGETIMGLLLQLDVIQGLHSSLRDIRKSVARELVSLQERLDSMTSQKSEGSKPTTDKLTNNTEQVGENLCQIDVDEGVPLGLEEEEKPSEFSKAPSIALQGDGTELNEPSDESLKSEHSPLEKECAHSEGNEVVHASLTNKIVEDSREQCEEEVLEPLVVEKEVQDNSEREATNTVVEPLLVKELTESPEMQAEEAHSKAVEKKPSTELKDEEEDLGIGSETLVTSEFESRSTQPDELPLVMDGTIESAADQLKEAIDDVVSQLSTLQEQPLEVMGETQSCGSEQNVVEPDTRNREEPCTQSCELDVEHEVTKEENPLVESAESADYDPKLGFSDLQPSGKEEFMDEELLKIPKLEDSAQIIQVADNRSNEEKLTEDQMIANVGSSQPVLNLPSDSTDNMVSSYMEDTEVVVKESENHIPGEKPMSDTEVPKMRDESIVNVAGEESSPCVQLEGVEEALEAPNVQEENGITDVLETVTGNDGVDYKSCASDQVVEEVTSTACKMEGEITSSDPVAQVNHEQPPKTLDDTEVGQVSLHAKDVVEDNEKLKEMVEKLIQAGKEQVTVISNLNGRIKELESKLKMKKQRKLRPRRVAASLSSSGKRSTGLSKGNSVICAA